MPLYKQVTSNKDAQISGSAHSYMHPQAPDIDTHIGSKETNAVSVKASRQHA